MIISGTVIHGDKVGRTMGFPTANLDVKLDEKQLKPGVYLATWKQEGEKEDPRDHSSDDQYGLAYFGPRFVFGESVNSFEIYLYDFSGDLYGQVLTVKLLDFMREPLPFTTLDALQTQLELDKANGLQLIAQRE